MSLPKSKLGTDDVDLIVDIVGYPAWADLQEQLKAKGFSIDMGNENLSGTAMKTENNNEY